MSRYIYAIGDHDESGSEHLMATLDREMVVKMFDIWGAKAMERTFPGEFYKRRAFEEHKEARKVLLKKLEQETDEYLAGLPVSLSDGWGGPLLHVIEVVI